MPWTVDAIFQGCTWQTNKWPKIGWIADELGTFHSGLLLKKEIHGGENDLKKGSIVDWFSEREKKALSSFELVWFRQTRRNNESHTKTKERRFVWCSMKLMLTWRFVLITNTGVTNKTSEKGQMDLLAEISIKNTYIFWKRLILKVRKCWLGP